MRRVGGVAGGLALALALSACGEGAGGQANPTDNKQDSLSPFSSLDELSSAAQQSADQAGTVKLSMEMTIEGVTITGTGEGRFTEEDPAMSVEMDMAGTKIEERIIDSSMYLKMPEGMLPEDNSLPDGKTWVQFSADFADEGSEEIGPLLEQFEQMSKGMDVSNRIEELKETGTITDSEVTELDGESATYYSIEQDMQKVVEQQGEMLDTSEKEIEQILDEVPETAQTELWLNDQQLPIQESISADPAELEEVSAGPEETTVRYTDWGTSVDIEEPPADEVVTSEELADI